MLKVDSKTEIVCSMPFERARVRGRCPLLSLIWTSHSSLYFSKSTKFRTKKNWRKTEGANAIDGGGEGGQTHENITSGSPREWFDRELPEVLSF